jgi:hypothetical protein
MAHAATIPRTTLLISVPCIEKIKIVSFVNQTQYKNTEKTSQQKDFWKFFLSEKKIL